MDKFIRVNKKNPCPQCGGSSWCCVFKDGTAVLCQRDSTGRPFVNARGETGWIHKLGPDAPRPAPSAHRDRPAPKRDVGTWERLASKFALQAVPGDVRALAGRLGVTVGSLQRLGIGQAACSELYLNRDPRRVFTFPMRNERAECIGIRTRHDDGAKMSMKGSTPGLFVPDAGMPEQLTRVIVCEGASDVAAALDLGFYALGRSSCQGEVPMLVKMLNRIEVVLIGDCDEAKKRRDGTTFKPGQEGAFALADALTRAKIVTRVVLPYKGKDLREWKALGATGPVIECAIRNTEPWTVPGR